jgi:antitoxin ParD1/3/4
LTTLRDGVACSDTNGVWALDSGGGEKGQALSSEIPSLAASHVAARFTETKSVPEAQMDEQFGLGPQDEAFIDEAVRSGCYAGRDEVVREGLRALRARDDRTALRAAMQRGIEDADAGRLIDIDEAFDKLDEYIGNMKPSEEGKRGA